LARFQGKNPQKSRSYLFLIPIIALASAAGVIALAFYNPPQASPVQNYVFQMTIQVTNANGSGLHFIIPTQAVGEAGGVWTTHQYDNESVDSGHYPIYMDGPPNPYPGYSLVHVKSKVNRQYTLGDFFAVWGKSLGQNDTISVKASGNFLWELCTGTSAGTAKYDPLWGATPLVPGLAVTLFYYDRTSLGCA
jgi:hypothetical protein